MRPGYVRFERHGAVAVIEIEHPPVNALAHAVREPLLALVEQLDADASVRAIVVHGVGRNFIAGADVREFDAGPKPPILNDVLLRLEGCSKPVIAALHGAALGGGAELALASHYRAATRDLSLGFPEINLGLLPGAGGTVRLPRIVGLKTTLEMMTGGAPIGFERAKALGIVDRELEGEPKPAAIAYAEELVAQNAPVRRLRERALPESESGVAGAATCAEFAKTLSKSAKRIPTAERIVSAVEACATRPFADALAHARTLFEACRTSTESRALRHLFFAERGGGEKGGTPREVKSIGVIGAGTMGAGIAISAATAGYSVILVDLKPEAVAAGLGKVHAAFDASLKKGRMTAAQHDAAKGRVTTATSLDALAGVDLVIEAVFENLAVKQNVFAQLGRICRPGAVLATNTSTLDVDAIASAAAGREADVVGMHFFSPANVMKLVEIVRGSASTAEALATVSAVTKKLGKVGVEVGNGFGFVGNRMLYAYGREKELMLLEGASPERIDRALEAFGMAMGPNAVGDLAGLDIGWNVRKEWKGKPDDPRFYRASDLLAEQGRYGQKTGRGFYRYVDGKREPDPEANALIRAEAERLGVPQREHTDEEIVERCMLALVNEGARILSDGIAKRAADIDVVWCLGYGYPRFRGGPMFYADTLGTTRVVERIRALAAVHGERYWAPAPLLEELARDGRPLNATN